MTSEKKPTLTNAWDYQKYINSKWWREKRMERLKLDGFKCQLCGSGMNLNVHHINYENLGKENIDDIVTLCRSCHAKVHRTTEEELKTKPGKIEKYRPVASDDYLTNRERNEIIGIIDVMLDEEINSAYDSKWTRIQKLIELKRDANNLQHWKQGAEIRYELSHLKKGEKE